MATAAPSEVWHYPPELIELVVDAVARLNRSKPGVLDFFRGSGVPERVLTDLAQRVAAGDINKFEIARAVLVRLNDAGDSMIGPRREILNRIVKTESFEHCWPNDRLAAKGVVAEIRDVVNKRDAFTRMKSERDKEREGHMRVKRREQEQREREHATRGQVKDDLFVLFGEKDPWKRGRLLEGVLNRLFVLDGISVRESFHLTGDEGQGIVEQVDGVIVLDGEIYLVEMKWLSEPVGTDQIAPHFVRVFSRDAARGIFISASGFSDPAVKQSTDALGKMVSVLCHLEELVRLFENPNGNVRDYFREKVHAAIAERRPWHRPVIA